MCGLTATHTKLFFMSKNTKGFLTVLVIGLVGYAVYHYTHPTKAMYAKKIIKYGKSSSYAGLLLFDTPFLKAWSEAAKKGSDSFAYASNRYNTLGGTKISS